MIVLLYPNFTNLLESPLWLLRQKKYNKAVFVLEKIAERNRRFPPDFFFKRLLNALEKDQFVYRDEGSDNKIGLIGKIKLLFFKRELRNQLLILCSISSSLYCIYYGIVTSVQDMGLKTFQYNGILVGFTQAVGFVLVLKFLPTQRRKASLLLIQSLLLLGAFMLVCVSFFKKTPLIRNIEGLISAILISTSVSALFSFMYVANGESFPTHIRGLAVGTILLVGKMFGSCAPYFNLLSKEMKVHVLTGSSMPLFLSIMTTMFLKETLTNDPKKVAKKT